MSLKLEFCPDLEHTFLNEDEFARRQEFAIIEDGEEKIFWTVCVWDTESLKTRVIVQQQGVFLGSVLCILHKNLFKIEPKPEQIIYTPVTPFRIGWRIVDITDAEEAYELYLDKLIA
jgi:hypothetical protein